MSVPDGIDAYMNASKTVLKQGEPLTVNCTVHEVDLVYFSWDIPNGEVSGSEATQPRFVRPPPPLTSARWPSSTTQIASRCRDTPRFHSPAKFL